MGEKDLRSASAELIALAREAGVTLATAESCTGGLVCGALTAVPGSSAAVMGGVVSYAIDVKRRVLGVSSEVLDDPALGAVSSECAEEMAVGAARVLHADVAVSVTGIAGPGGAEPGKPVGTVYIGISAQGLDKVIKPELRSASTRARIRNMSAGHALDLVRREILLK